MYVVNTGSVDLPVALNLTGWGIGGAGVNVTVERVNASSYGEVSELLTTSAGGALSVVRGFRGSGWGGGIPGSNRTLR